jgi:hypothetical protein
MKRKHRVLGLLISLTLVLAILIGASTVMARPWRKPKRVVVVGSSGVAYIKTAPPPAKVEVRPRKPCRGAIWISGHWKWESGKYVWVKGRWETKPAGSTWVPGHWKKKPRGWVWVPGHWK